MEQAYKLWKMKVTDTARKVSVFWVILVRIFPHSDWIRNTVLNSVFSRNTENADQNNSKYGHFPHSAVILIYFRLCIVMVVIYYCWKERNYKVLKFLGNNSSWIVIRVTQNYLMNYETLKIIITLQV